MAGARWWRRCVAVLGRLPGFRPAEPGEFTRRAFENGKLDLTGVEGLADLIGAETEAQRRQAFRQLAGLLGERAEGWRTRLIAALALVEAIIDFPDEGDVPHDLVAPALDDCAGAARGNRRVARRSAPRRAVAGRAGGRDRWTGKCRKIEYSQSLGRASAAIVSPHAGTTRDVIEVTSTSAGIPSPFSIPREFAIRDDPVEQEGVRRARERASQARPRPLGGRCDATPTRRHRRSDGRGCPDTWVVLQ